ncbi:Trp-Asp repeats-containing protein [Punctularia strigosozonata HHB-11173 SS5]|uniref:Trp-Asp repeat-containing protein n=1 Tax=Punctularia strigosozonata (strain HHB-11173) TaxID=741275 RepID=UPI0004416CD1|nr:Trp-Asp repeat-containing protein [Punctularia strigosozonata HHB-11173 SS5]EIN10362.1 Trp-Asp repeats-containing protein [Punctularia strigosozonata HHB-11173 SS5]
MDYQPVLIQKHARPATAKRSSESRYWRQFRHPVFVKDYAPITSIHFSPAKPHRFAVTSATRVQIYAPRTQKVTKTISRFKDIARSGCIRVDGKLLVAGDDTGLIQVFDVNSRAILRTLDSHKQPVHVTKFSTQNPTQVLSCSDDTTVKLWDVPSQAAVNTFISHTDYVRSGQVAPSNPHLILTGSYDATVRLYDARTNECEMVLGGSSSSSGSAKVPVEQVLMFPSGTVALASAGPILRVYDLVAGGRCTRALSNHQKTVTSLAFDSSASRLLTAGLDQMVKVYDVSTYKVVHTMRYPAPVLCLAISPDETHIAAGMSDGTLSIRRRRPKASDSMDDTPFSADALRAGTYESFLGGALSFIGQGKVKSKVKSRPIGDVDELRVESKRKKRLRDYDRLLKGFKYSAALDSVLRKQVPPTTTFSLIQELIHRDGLRSALSGRDDVLLEPILRLLVKHATDPRFGEMVCDVAKVVIEMYTPVLGQSPLIDSLFLRLQKKVATELRFQQELVKTRGALDMVFASAALALAETSTPIAAS